MPLWDEKCLFVGSAYCSKIKVSVGWYRYFVIGFFIPLFNVLRVVPKYDHRCSLISYQDIDNQPFLTEHRLHQTIMSAHNRSPIQW